MAGDSGTPLAKKLGIQPNAELFVYNRPKEYAQLIGPMPEGGKIVSKITKATDLIQMFSINKLELANVLKSTMEQMKPNAAIWVSWPKRSSKVPTDITEDIIREIALPMGLVDIKVCAINETWSGLKLVIRRKNRKTG
jgi:hypothetical protein